MNPAQSARLSKEKYPNEWCKAKGCLWRTQTRQGYKPCPKHSEAMRSETAVQAGNLGDSSPRDVGRGASIPTATLAAEREVRLQQTDHTDCDCRKCGGTDDL